MEQVVTFPSGQVRYLFESSFSKLKDLHSRDKIIFITDNNVYNAHTGLFEGYKVVVVNAGEKVKTLSFVEHVISRLLQLGATRTAVLVGVGGGVISDLTGFVASIYMRGVQFGFVPTTLLGMVDAAIGGKNGVNIELFKNIAGVINQPGFILYDSSLLQTLPDEEWSNGFAEVIKYACLFDAPLFEELGQHDLQYYMANEAALANLVTRCAEWKNEIVAGDEHETGARKLLNFGHTAAHAIENLYELPHGQAVAIGMVIATTLSEQITGLDAEVTKRLKALLTQYGLPVNFSINVPEAMNLLQMDKKRNYDMIDYILLEEIGKAVIKPLTLDVIEKAMNQCAL